MSKTFICNECKLNAWNGDVLLDSITSIQFWIIELSYHEQNNNADTVES